MTTLVLLALLVLAVGWAHAQIFPMRVCTRCKGAGEVGPGPHALRVCPRCGGTKRTRRLFAPRK